MWNSFNLAKCIKRAWKIFISFDPVIPLTVYSKDIKEDAQKDLGTMIFTVLYNGISSHISEKLWTK